MEKRTILAIILSILILVVFSYLTPRPVKKQVKPEQPKEGVKTEEKQIIPKEIISVPAVPIMPVSEEREIKVETDLYSAVFTTRGGTIKRWELKKYMDSNKKPVALVPSDAALPPLSIIIEGQTGDLPVKSIYNTDVDKGSIILNSENKNATLSLFYADPSGLTIKKEFKFYNDNYRVDVSTDVKGASAYHVVLGSGFGIFDEKGTWIHIGPVLLRDSSRIEIDKDNIEGIGFLKKITGTKSKDEVTHTGSIWWIAQEDKYFASILASLSKTNDARIWKSGKDGKGVEIAFKVNGGKDEFLLYAGPKNYEILKPIGAGLEHIIDFGTFSIIARPLFWLLKAIYKGIGNYGWAIILLTIIVRIPFIPLLNKSQKSMKKLQELQPQMNAIKEKYKKDPQKMQKETMELYKKHKVNPMGGCLPMLIQIPVFLALYKILLVAIELRGAPFVLWITDLSIKDPYYVFPILMGVTMVIQQKMTPTTMDPTQAKIMMLMPIIFTFMFLSFPAGLVLYWLVNNILAIIQQYYINKKAKSFP